MPKLKHETTDDYYDEMISQDFGINSIDLSCMSSQPPSPRSRFLKLDSKLGSKTDESFAALEKKAEEGYFDAKRIKPVTACRLPTIDQQEQEQDLSPLAKIVKFFGKDDSVQNASAKKKIPSPSNYDLNNDALLNHILPEYDMMRKTGGKDSWNNMEKYSGKTTYAESGRPWKKYLKTEPDVEETEQDGFFCGFCTSRKKLQPQKERESRGWLF